MKSGHKPWIFALSALVLSPLLLASAPAKDPLLGKWQSQERGGVTAFERCGDAICGRVIDGDSLRANPDLRDVKNGNASLRSRKVKGMIVLHNFKGGPKQWKGGPLYDPERGMGVQSGTITLVDQNTIKVTGCFGGFICQSEVMSRVR
ncbi:DUF2147 domain-containing protein [Sphingomonas sp. C3-2]|uniref:DUF2147 domain-containing protein n=1 Tax=Sphingomonas sp. C3-2 TaxID=3062169 RepID=UPI00294B8B46|nr:DUF2147 domain-containing protein [Sphingomonas sp. C3-2]WOK36758.1 DUF2147 domain-containing protein [Sphingomonas sp. C3-2]